jgi:lysozyme family protein
MLSKRFLKFFPELMASEGWISDDEFDKGGHTIVGITETHHPQAHSILVYMIENKYDKDLITSFIESFYYINYYNPLYDNVNDSSLVFKIFDFGVNAGIRTSVKILQRTHNQFQSDSKIKVDGVFGNNTLKAINLDSVPKDECTETKFYHLYISNIEKYYRSLWNFFRFGKGWMNRLKRIFNGAPNLTLAK